MIVLLEVRQVHANELARVRNQAVVPAPKVQAYRLAHVEVAVVAESTSPLCCLIGFVDEASGLRKCPFLRQIGTANNVHPEVEIVLLVGGWIVR
jgi:hypothetical protein